GFSIPEYNPGEADTRLEVERALLVRLRLMNQRIGSCVEYDEASPALRRCTKPVVAQTQLDREVTLYLPGVQRETANRVDENPACAIGAVGCKLTCLIVDECSDTREGKRARREAEVVVVDSAVFTSELQGVIAAGPTQRVRCNR